MVFCTSSGTVLSAVASVFEKQNNAKVVHEFSKLLLVGCFMKKKAIFKTRGTMKNDKIKCKQSEN